MCIYKIIFFYKYYKKRTENMTKGVTQTKRAKTKKTCELIRAGYPITVVTTPGYYFFEQI